MTPAPKDIVDATNDHLVILDTDRAMDGDKNAIVRIPASSSGKSNKVRDSMLLVLLGVVALCCILLVAELGSIISFQSQQTGSTASQASMPTININGMTGEVTTSGTSSTVGTGNEGVPDEVKEGSIQGTNVCAGKKPDLPDAACVVDAMTNVGPQAGANVTKGYQGDMQVDYLPITTPYWMNGMCPVNVHWHLGAEHLSVGEYDENGKGPGEIQKLDGDARHGFRCNKYDETDAKFTTPYEWKHCKEMEVGETYEVHWPHSAAGACGTPNQYQTPFYDGVFCTDGVLTDTAAQVGVQSQVFVIVNDESYYWPELFRGMIVDGEMGQDVAKYTGSTTGDKRNNDVCSQYSPITWQVDRKCHMVSASTFDKMCADMKAQRDDMSDDLHPHGARELVDDNLASNNHQNRFLRK